MKMWSNIDQEGKYNFSVERSSSFISGHVLYHHEQQVLLFKEVVMKQQKLKLCRLHTKKIAKVAVKSI